MSDVLVALRTVAGIVAFFAMILWIIACEGILDVLSAALSGAL